MRSGRSVRSKARAAVSSLPIHPVFIHPATIKPAQNNRHKKMTTIVQSNRWHRPGRLTDADPDADERETEADDGKPAGESEVFAGGHR